MDGLNTQTRAWRSRRQAWSRRFVAETRLEASDFVLPIIVASGSNIVRPIEGMPGVNSYSLDNIWRILDSVLDFGIPSVMLIPENEMGRRQEGYDVIAMLQQEILPKIHEKKLPLGIMVDINYQQIDHLAFEGLIKDGRIMVDRTIEALIQHALGISEAGANIICLPGHLAGCVLETRRALDKSGFSEVIIVSNAAHYASSLNLQSHTWESDSWTRELNLSDYLLNIANAREAEREAMLDAQEGADWMMVQPASSSQDVIYRISQKSSLPVIAYQLSGEYLQSRLYAEARQFNPTQVIYESLLAIKRSGASAICTHAALDVVKELEAFSLA